MKKYHKKYVYFSKKLILIYQWYLINSGNLWNSKTKSKLKIMQTNYWNSPLKNNSWKKLAWNTLFIFHLIIIPNPASYTTHSLYSWTSAFSSPFPNQLSQYTLHPKIFHPSFLGPLYNTSNGNPFDIFLEPASIARQRK